MAVRGDFSWPSLGNCAGRPRGILVAACGEIAMAVDKGPHREVVDHQDGRSAPATQARLPRPISVATGEIGE